MVARNRNAFPSGNTGRQDQGDDETIVQGGPIPAYEASDKGDVGETYPRDSNGNRISHEDHMRYKG